MRDLELGALEVTEAWFNQSGLPTIFSPLAVLYIAIVTKSPVLTALYVFKSPKNGKVLSDLCANLTPRKIFRRIVCTD